ncbi:alpha/beta hydrolase, partial [Clostridium saudiense]|nr:alpha/beta hydrolase [Clostridium saudiense]
LVGFVYQKISNFIAKETLRQGVDYTTVDDRRMDFRLEGEGNYTVVFDGDIGGNLEQWTPVVDELSDDNVSTFVYNRRGYGYSDSGSERTPEEQAQDLKILLRKAGAPEPYILVGEGYGSLVLTSFAEQFKDSVAGVMLINPLDESYIGTKDYNKKQIITKLRRKIEKVGSNFGLTELLDKLNLDVSLDDFESSLSGEELDEFKTQRTKTKYTTAVYNEMNVLSKGLSDSQKVGVFTGMPYYLMTSFDNDNLKNLGDESLTKVYKTETTST